MTSARASRSSSAVPNPQRHADRTQAVRVRGRHVHVAVADHRARGAPEDLEAAATVSVLDSTCRSSSGAATASKLPRAGRARPAAARRTRAAWRSRRRAAGPRRSPPAPRARPGRPACRAARPPRSATGRSRCTPPPRARPPRPPAATRSRRTATARPADTALDAHRLAAGRRERVVHAARDRQPRVGQHPVEVEEDDLDRPAQLAARAASSGSTNVGPASSSGRHCVFGAIARVTTRSL